MYCFCKNVQNQDSILISMSEPPDLHLSMGSFTIYLDIYWEEGANFSKEASAKNSLPIGRKGSRKSENWFT